MFFEIMLTADFIASNPPEKDYLTTALSNSEIMSPSPRWPDFTGMEGKVLTDTFLTERNFADVLTERDRCSSSRKG